MSEPASDKPSNYKGILLSNRPTHSAGQQQASASRAQNAASGADGPIPFMPSGIVRDPHVGLPPNKERNNQNATAKLMLAQKMKYAPQASVTYQHKQYIRQLQAEKQQEKLNLIEKELSDNEKRKRFQDSQAKLRQMMKEADYSERDIKTFLKTGKMPTTAQTGVESVAPSNAAASKSASKRKKKPAWLTQHKKKSTPTNDDPLADLPEEEEELDDLLDFANKLDFDDFIDDFEVREALAVIHSRVKEMEEELTEEEKAEREQQRQMRIEEARQRGADMRALNEQLRDAHLGTTRAQHQKDWDSSTRVDAQNMPRSAGTDILIDEDKTLKQIHSKASLGQLKSKAEKSNPLTLEEAEQELERLMETVHRERAQRGVVVTHSALNARGDPEKVQEIAPQVSAEDRSRILLKLKKDPNSVQNLPYMYRCPSI